MNIIKATGPVLDTGMVLLGYVSLYLLSFVFIMHSLWNKIKIYSIFKAARPYWNGYTTVNGASFVRFIFTDISFRVK